MTRQLFLVDIWTQIFLDTLLRLTPRELYKGVIVDRQTDRQTDWLSGSCLVCWTFWLQNIILKADNVVRNWTIRYSLLASLIIYFYLVFSLDSAAGVVTVRNSEQFRLGSMQGREVFFFRLKSRPPLEQTCLAIYLVPEALSWG